MISIKGLPKGAVLAALHNGATPQGLGLIHARAGLTDDDATAVLARSMYVDYCAGRPIKIDFSGDEIDPRLFDRDAGQGACEKIIARLRASLNIPA